MASLRPAHLLSVYCYSNFVVNFTDECFQITPSGCTPCLKNVNKNAKTVKTARPVVDDAPAHSSLAVRLTAFGGSVDTRGICLPSSSSPCLPPH
jgi:hypothetical protein